MVMVMMVMHALRQGRVRQSGGDDGDGDGTLYAKGGCVSASVVRGERTFSENPRRNEPSA